MELLAYSIIKLICKEAASGTYNGALEILQKMMSECKYHESNAFVIMGAGEQLKRIKYDVNEDKLKVYRCSNVCCSLVVVNIIDSSVFIYIIKKPLFFSFRTFN